MKPERTKQSKELQKAVHDREKRVEDLVSFITLAFSEGRKNQNEKFETSLQKTLKTTLERFPDPLIVEAGLLDSREMLLISIINGAYDPLARKLQKTISKKHSENDIKQDLYDRWFNEAVVTAGDSIEEQMEWLKSQTPDVWHIVLDGWNFDFTLDWNWFAQHPNIDAGTAANLFIPCAESYLSGEFKDPMYEMLNIISKRWMADDFRTGLYKISQDFCDTTFWRDEYFKTYDNLVNAGRQPAFPRLDSLWAYKGEVDPITPYQQEHSVILKRYDLWLKSLKE